MRVIARKLTENEPQDVQWWIAWADATRRAESVEAARLILVAALEGLDHAGPHCDLACYKCRLGNVQAAKDCLKKCFDIDPSWRIIALESEDFKPLWESP
jgi:hypothetical protein